MTCVEISGSQLDLVQRGKGQPVLLVHGSSSDRRTWQEQLETFSERFRVTAYSRRFHWPNDSIPDGADYSMVEHVDDLEQLIDSLGLGPAHLVGHSYGAFVSLLLAVRRPSLVRSLVLAEPPVLTLFTSNQPKPAEILKLLFTRPRTAFAIIKFGARGVAPTTAALQRGDREEALECSARAVLGKDSFASLSPERLQQARDNFIDAEFLGSGFAPLTADQVRAISVPVLLMTGGRSPRLFHRFVDRLEGLLPDVERVEIPGASHIIHEDNGPAYNEAVLSFLAKHSH